MLVSSIGIAIGAQVIAVLLDGLLRRRPISTTVLSVARYTVAFGAAQVVYAALRGEQLFENSSAFTSQDVLPALAAAATLLVINMALISAAVAFRSGDSVREHLRENLHFMISGSVLATLAPVVAAVMNFNVWLVPLLLLPILAVQRTAGAVPRARAPGHARRADRPAQPGAAAVPRRGDLLRHQGATPRPRS